MRPGPGDGPHGDAVGRSAPLGGLSAATLAAIAARAALVDRGEQSLGHELDLLRGDAALPGRLPPLAGPGAAAAQDAAARLLHALGTVSLPLARLAEGHLNALDLAARLATSAQRRALKAELATGALLGVWGADEPARPLVARPDSARPGGWLLNGAKRFASGLGLVSRAIVSARAGEATRLFLVPVAAGRAEPEQWTMSAMRGTRSGGWTAQDLAASTGEALGGPDAWFAEPGFFGGLWRLVMAYAGAMDSLAARADTAARDRGDGETARHRLGGLLTEARAARLWADDARRAVLAADGAAAPAMAQRAALAGLLARDAVSEAALRLLDGWARLAGTARFEPDSAGGLLARDLDLFLRQADPDGKRMAALDLWREERAGRPSVG